MVLTRRSAVLVVLLLAGCSESLFGAHHVGQTDDGGTAGSDGSDAVPGACTAPCIGDAAGDFNGTPGGMNGRWRYLDDYRTPPLWTPMTASGGEMTGGGSNRITTCSLHPDRAACGMLPGALLVSSTGAIAGTDPAIELTALTPQVVQLSLRVYLAAGADQTIWLYRNSREDVLFKGVATAGAEIDRALTLDALPGDRFLVAVSPTGAGAADIGVQLFGSALSHPVPSTCQLALRFDTIVGNSTSDLTCVQRSFTHLDDTGHQTALAQGGPPYSELNSALSNPGGTYLHDFDPSSPLDYSQDVTVQLWANVRTFVNAGAASLFSDLGASDGGIAISILPGSPGTVAVTSRTASGVVEADGSYPAPDAWHFLRVVRTATNLRVCVDGAQAGSVDAALVRLPATLPPDLGKDLPAPSSAASLDGLLDDLRVITGALPCE